MRQSFAITEQWQKIIFTIVILLALWVLRDILALLILALTVAAAVTPFVNYLVKRNWSRVLAVIFVYLTLLFIVAVILFFLVPSIMQQVRGIAQQLPNFYDRFVDLFQSFELVLERSQFIDSPQQILNQFSELLTRWASGILLSTFSLLGTMVSFVVVLVISFFLVVRERGIEDFWRALMPLRHEEYILDLWRRVNKKIGRWLQAQLLLSVIIGLMTYIGLRIFDVPFALTLAVIAAVFELIPFIGPIIAAIPAVILGFANSTSLGVIMIFLYVIIQQLENNLITPTITRKLVGLNPVIVILALIAGGTLAGIVGMLIAIPITVTVVEIFDDFAARKHTDRKSRTA